MFVVRLIKDFSVEATCCIMHLFILLLYTYDYSEIVIIRIIQVSMKNDIRT